MSRTGAAAFDVVVLGAGAGGMAAALFATLHGLSAVVIEKAVTVGGTTAVSAGTAWIPGTIHAASVQPVDTRDEAERYLQAAVGERLDRRKLQAFLSGGPVAVALLHERTAVRFRARPHHPDYLSDRDGASLSGRALEPLPFDGRLLGRRLRLLRPPLPALTLWGMMLGADDIKTMMAARRSPRAAPAALCLLLRHGVDRLRHGRGTRLMMGNALCGRLLHSLDAAGVPIWTQAAMTDLLTRDGRVSGVRITRAGQVEEVVARRGVVLATGGFAHSPRLRAALLPIPAETAMPREIEGDGMEAATALDAAIGTATGPDGAAFWAPISIHRRRGRADTIYPHFFLDRGKPGVLAVDASGRRFVNEATSYDAFVRAMHKAGINRCFLIAEARAARQYGLGLMLPGYRRRRRLLKDGYLHCAGTVAGLAAQLGLDPATLQATVDRFNAAAARGFDPDFHRGDFVANLAVWL